jgi:tetratricopeptide (TPR) repeat protein
MKPLATTKRRVCGKWSKRKLSLLAVVLFVSRDSARAESWEVSYQSGMSAFDQGRFDEARQRLEAALATSNLGTQDVRRAEICAALASAYQALGEPIKAEFQFRAAQSIIESQRDAKPTLKVAILSEIGLFLLDQRRADEARLLLEQALQASHEAFGDRNLTTAMASTRLARYFKDAGRLHAAEKLLSRAVEVYENIRPSRSADRLMAQADLGVLYASQGRYSLAEPILQRAYEIAHGFGETHYLFAQSLTNLAYLYRLRGNSARGAPLLRKALAIYENSLGPDNIGVADVLLNMSNDEIADRNFSVAEGQIKRALEIFSKANGPDRLNVAIGESRLADVYIQQRKYTEAEPLLRHALSIREVPYLEGHRVAGYCHYLLAELAKDRRQYADAERNYQRAISIYEKTGPFSPGLAVALQHYAELLRINRGAESKALAMRAKELQIALKSFR